MGFLDFCLVDSRESAGTTSIREESYFTEMSLEEVGIAARSLDMGVPLKAAIMLQVSNWMVSGIE